MTAAPIREQIFRLFIRNPLVALDLRYYFGMAGMWMPRWTGSTHTKAEMFKMKMKKSYKTAKPLVRAIGWASVATGAVAVGFYVGRNIRARYRHNRRTPYDYFSHAGDNGNSVEYGVGV